MNEAEHRVLVDEKNVELPDTFTFSDFRGECAVNGKIALALEIVSPLYEIGEEIVVEDEIGTPLGILCLCKGIDLDLSTITEVKYAAYINEVEPEFYAEPYSYKFNHFVVDINRIDKYSAKYRNTSSLWGNFIHKEPGGSRVNNYKIKPSFIKAIDNLNFPTLFHQESCFRSVVQPYAFERFLKLYHLLELLFDQEIVERIQTLGADLQGIGQILSNYQHTEIERLKSILNNKCKNIYRIEYELNRIGNSADYLIKAKKIFFEYYKAGNPFKDKESEFEQMIGNGGFSESNAKTYNIISPKPVISTAQYRKLLIDTSVYWIYRVRSSIAHHRIGEYLMTNEDEEFVAEVIEPLLHEVLFQAFKR